MADKLFILSAGLMKSEPGKIIYSIMQGYRLRANEDEATGSFVASVMAEKPGYSITEVLCMAVPGAAIRSLPIEQDSEVKG